MSHQSTLQQFSALLCLTAFCGCGNQSGQDSSSTTPAQAEIKESNAASLKEPTPAPHKLWPTGLKNVLGKLKETNQRPEFYEVVYADFEEDPPDYTRGYYWRMPANPAIIEFHVEEFEMDPVEATSRFAKKFLVRYPETWPKLSTGEIEWYAWPFGNDDPALDSHFWKIMAWDREREELFFFYWIWDIPT